MCYSLRLVNADTAPTWPDMLVLIDAKSAAERAEKAVEQLVWEYWRRGASQLSLANVTGWSRGRVKRVCARLDARPNLRVPHGTYREGQQ